MQFVDEAEQTPEGIGKAIGNVPRGWSIWGSSASCSALQSDRETLRAFVVFIAS
jgi:hypothetical protein